MEPLTRASPTYPIAVMSFDRPHYLESVLRSLAAQTVPIAATEIFLFQDGYRSRNGHDLADPRRVEHCMELFKTIFPGGKTFSSTENLGVAFNFARAENYFFDELGTSAAFFFEDDLILSPHYLTALYALTAIALEEKRIAYIAAYGDHRASLAEQKSSANKLILMRHKWGFALTRRQWLAQRDILAPYLEILATADYRTRDHAAIRQYFKELGFASNGTSQDGMKDVASCVLGTVKIMSAACFGKYIGEVGLHSNSRLYQDEGYDQTSLFPEEISSFDTPSSAILDKWAAGTRAEGRKALRSIELGSFQPLRLEGATQAANHDPLNSELGERMPEDAAENLARALYHVLLLREPDPAGLDSALRQLQSGKSIEDLMRWCLGSREFAENREKFLRTYVAAEMREHLAGRKDERATEFSPRWYPTKIGCEELARADAFLGGERGDFARTRLLEQLFPGADKSKLVIAEFGIWQGGTSVHFARFLNGFGELHLFDFEDNVRLVTEMMSAAGHKNVQGWGCTYRHLNSYNWSLKRLMEERPTLRFDYVYLDGAHTWAIDALTFFLCDMLLKDNGYIEFDDYLWTLQGSSLDPKNAPIIAEQYTDEQIKDYQVRAIVNLIVRNKPNYREVQKNRVFQKRSTV